MLLSRLRMRLAAWFALAFVAALSLLNLVLYAYLRHQSDQRLTRDLRRSAVELAVLIRDEYLEQPANGLQAAAREALMEWPPRSESFVAYGESGARLAERGDTALLHAMPARLAATPPAVRDVQIGRAHPVRLVTLRPKETPRIYVVASGSTDRVIEENEALALWLGFSTPLVLALSLGGGYVLSRRALIPIRQLEREVAALAPDALDRRLPVAAAPDEIDQLAQQFNGLLERLERAQTQNRRFIRQATHQIRTPLTLVLGEAALSLDRPRTPVEQTAALQRVRAAAQQMKRRVDELFLLAQAEAGERPDLGEIVELDGLVLECADLMRGRAQALGRRLELCRVDPLSVRGNEALLKEALLELIENACRHGGADHPIGISTFVADCSACLVVASQGSAVPVLENGVENSRLGAPDLGEAHGLGLTIVRWIASEHGGGMSYERNAGLNVYGLRLPMLPTSEQPPTSDQGR